MLYCKYIQPKVLQIIPHLKTGGVERGAIDTCFALQALGNTPFIISSSEELTVKKLEYSGIIHMNLPIHAKNPLLFYRNTHNLASLVTKLGVNIIHIRSRAPAWPALAAATYAGVPLLTTFHGNYTTGVLTVKKFYNAIMARGNDLVIAVSHFISAHIQAVYNVSPERIRVIPRGVDLHQFNPDVVHPNRLSILIQTWNLSRNHPIIMLPARFVQWKGHTVLIDAITQLGRQDIQCLLVGERSGYTYYNELKRMIASRGLESIIQVVDYCGDMPAAYMLTDIVISASTEPEAFGRITLEAQAMGRPVVATDHGGSRETVIHGKTGLLIPPNCANALTQAISTFLALGFEERKIMSLQQRIHVQSLFSCEAMCARTLSAYQELLFSWHTRKKN